MAYTARDDAAFSTSREHGFTKLEYIATAAMQGLLTDSNGNYGPPEKVAEYAVKYAEALIYRLNETSLK